MAGLEGQIIGGCRIVRRLGGGGMGEVYLAEQISLQRQVALKLVRPELEARMSGTSAAERFAREARAIAAMEHPHILPVYDFGEQDGLAYLVMAYAPSGSLQEALTPSSPNARWSVPLAPELVGTMLDQAAQALQHAHDRGVLHRDIKPANFLLRAPDASGGVHLLLADFGLAKFASTGQSSALYAGTAAYSAPEQIQRQAVPASDQYGLAVMLYLLLTGRLPFTGDAVQVLYQQVQTPAPSLRTHMPGLSADVDAVVLRALAKRPEERWPSVAAFAAAYQAALRGQKQPAVQAAASSWQTPAPGIPPVQQPAMPQAVPQALPQAVPFVQQSAMPQVVSPSAQPPAFYASPAQAETIPTMHPPGFAPTLPGVGGPIGSGPRGSGPSGGPVGSLPFPAAGQQRTEPGYAFGGESLVPGISPPAPYILPTPGGKRQRGWGLVVGGGVALVAVILAVVLVVNLLGTHGRTSGRTGTGTPGTGVTVPVGVGTIGPHISNVQTGLFLDATALGSCQDRLDPTSPATTTFQATVQIISVVFTAAPGAGDPAPAAVVVLIDSQQRIVGGGNAQGDGTDLLCPGKGNYSLSVPIKEQNVIPGKYFVGISYIPNIAVYAQQNKPPLPAPEAGVQVTITG